MTGTRVLDAPVITGFAEIQRLVARQQRAEPGLSERKLRFEEQRRRLPSRSGLAEALRYFPPLEGCIDLLH